MVNHQCPNCGEVFDKKSTFIYHINRKRPCIKITPKITPITPKITQITPITQKIATIELIDLITKTELIQQELIKQDEKNIPICIEIKNKKIEKKFICKFCNHNFLRKYNLERHLNKRCKSKQKQEQKQEQEQEQEQEQKQEQEQEQEQKKEQEQEQEQKQEKNNIKINDDCKKSTYDKKLIEDDKKYNFILKRLNDLENENKKLKIKIKKTKKTTNININQNNNIINQNNILINFNDLKLEDIDKKLFTNPLLNSRLQGKFIILQMIENVYINETHPEYQNIMITDKNRGYVKIYNNGRWKTDNIETINMIIDGIISHSKNILIELKQQYLNNIGVKNRLNTSEKYVNLCDLDYLEDLRDEQEHEDVNNKERIKRCEDFREMVYKDTINLFHDNKKTLLKHKNNKVVEIN